MEFGSLLVLALGIIGKNLVAQASGEDTELGKLLDAVVGNRADAVAMAPWTLVQQLKQDRSPLTEQVTRALWLSHQQALLDIAKDRRTQLIGPTPQIYRGRPIYPEDQKENINWYNAHIDGLQQQIKHIKQNKASLPELNLADLDDVVATAQASSTSPLLVATNQLTALAPDMAPSCYGEALKERLAPQVYACFAQQVNEHEVLWKFVQTSLMNGLAQNDRAILTVLEPTAQNVQQLVQGMQEIKTLLQSQSVPVAIPAQIIEIPADQPNPFIYPEGRIEDTELFFDRETTLREIFTLLNSGSNVELVGPRKIGKSSLLKAIERNTSRSLTIKREPVYIDFNWVNGENDFYQALCHFLKIENCKGFALTRALKAREPALLLLDEIEKMNWESFTKQILSQLRGWAEGRNASLKWVMAASKPLDKLFPDSHDGLMTSPIGGICQPVIVRPWSSDEIQSFIQTRLGETGVYFSEADIQELIQTSRGNPREVVRGGFELYAKYREE